MDSLKIGSLGSWMYAGATVGCLAAIPLLDILPTKWTLLFCMVCQAIALLSFTIAEDYFHLAIGRFFSGMC